jgi:hypothetical protein
MKKMIRRTVCLATLVLICSGSISPCLAYYAPLTDITGPTVVQDTETRVTVSVHNPATGQDIPGVWTIPGGAGTIAVDQPNNHYGVVAWRVKNLTTNKYQIVCSVYDPNPAMGWQFFSNWGEWLDYETNILLVNDGVVLYESKYTPETPSWENPSVIRTFWATYDPAQEMPGHPWFVGWRSFNSSYTDHSGGTAYGHYTKDGVVAYLYWSPSYDWVMTYAIYNSRHHFWEYSAEYPPNPTAPSITNATVTWNDSNGAQKRGYDSSLTISAWLPGTDTKVMANFVFAPLAPRPNQPVYFTDMSIGATTWNYDLGDSSSTSDPSFYHRYAKAGNFLVSQQATGPAGTDVNNQNVLIKGSGTEALLLLLLE